MLAQQSMWFVEIAQVMKNHFPDYPIGTKTVANWLLKIASWFDSDLKMLIPLLNKEMYAVTSKS